MDEQELEALLKPFGQVVSTRILRDPHGASRGVGFARYGGGVQEGWWGWGGLQRAGGLLGFGGIWGWGAQEDEEGWGNWDLGGCR